MSIYFENNMRVLLETFPDLVQKIYRPHREYCLFLARSGSYTVRMNEGNKLLHSLIDPWREAKRFVQEQAIQPSEERILLFGLGLGYHARAILQSAHNLKELAVIELNPEIMKAAMDASDISDIISDKRVHMLLPENDHSFLRLLQGKFENIHNNPRVILHTPSVQTYKERFPIAHSILEMFKVRRLNSRRNRKLLRDNFYASMELLKTDPGVSKLYGTQPSRSIVLAGSGPSLDQYLDELHRLAADSYIIAGNSVVNKLLREGIRPDLVVVMDPSPRIRVDIPSAECADIPLVYISTADPEYVSRYPGQRYAAWAHKGGHDLEFARAFPKGELASGFGTMIGPALDLAVKLGGNPIYLIGVDLAFTPTRKYSTGIDRDTEKIICSLFDVDRLIGSDELEAYTTPGLRYSRTRLEEFLDQLQQEKPELQVINISDTILRTTTPVATGMVGKQPLEQA